MLQATYTRTNTQEYSKNVTHLTMEGTLSLKVRGEDVEVEVSLEAGVLTIVSTEKFELLHTFNVTPGTSCVSHVSVGLLSRLLLTVQI
jgi:hypothetical protein